MPANPRWFSPPLYGLKTCGDLFTRRQLVALTTFSDLVQEARERVKHDAIEAGLGDPKALRDGGSGATAYAEAVGVYLAFALSRSVDRDSTLCSWDNSPKKEALRNTFGRQAIPMTWDFAEGNPFSESSGNWMNNVEWGAKAVASLPGSAAAMLARPMRRARRPHATRWSPLTRPITTTSATRTSPISFTSGCAAP